MENLKGKKLLILGAYGTEIEIVKCAQTMGVCTIVTDNHTDWSLAPAKYAADEAWDVSWTDYETLEKMCLSHGVDGIMGGFSERRVACVQELSSRLGLPFYANGADLNKILRKDNFREACVSAGVDVPKCYSYNDICLPVIMKPADNGGSRGITVVRNDDDIAKAYKKAANASDTNSVVIEEYITADEVMIYYVVHNGIATLSAMCDRYMHVFDSNITQLPVGYRFPSKHLELFENKHDEKFKKLIAELGIQNGLIAFQSFVDGDRVLPFDPTYRLDGTMAYYTTQHANGSNVLERLIEMSLTGSMGNDEEISSSENPHTDAIRFQLPILLGKGVVSSIEGKSEIEKIDGVYFVNWRIGEGEKMLSSADFSQIACRIQLYAANEDDLYQKLSQIFNTLKIEDENGNSLIIYSDAGALAYDEVQRC